MRVYDIFILVLGKEGSDGKEKKSGSKKNCSSRNS